MKVNQNKSNPPLNNSTNRYKSMYKENLLYIPGKSRLDKLKHISILHKIQNKLMHTLNFIQQCCPSVQLHIRLPRGKK